MMPGSRKFHLHNGQSGAAITVRVTPRAGKNKIAGILDDGTIKIRITASPIYGKANQSLINYLSKVLQCSKEDIEIVAGETGRDKLIAIANMNADDVNRRIMEELA